MSHYTTLETSITQVNYLVEALVKSGFNKEDIEIHETPACLYGYEDDVRPESANVIIRKHNVGRAANDIGFVKQENGNYKVIVSEYDQCSSKTYNKLARESNGYNDKFMGRLLALYAESASVAELKAQGCEVEIVRNSDGIKVIGKRTTKGGQLVKFGRKVTKKAKGLFA